MLTLLIVVLLVLWLTGAVAFPAVGGSLVHVLLVVVVILIVIRLLQGRKVL